MPKPTKLRPSQGGKMWGPTKDTRIDSSPLAMDKTHPCCGYFHCECSKADLKYHTKTRGSTDTLPRVAKWEDIKKGAKIRYKDWLDIISDEHIVKVNQNCLLAYRAKNIETSWTKAVPISDHSIREGRWLLVTPAPAQKKEEENKPSILYDGDVHILGVDKNHIFNKYEPTTWKPGMVIKESPNSNHEVTLGTRRTNNSGWYSSTGGFYSDSGLQAFSWRVTDWKDVKWD